MSASYQHLPLAHVAAGMVLSDVLLDMHGKVLLPQGTVLSAAMLALMPRHGITVLAVQLPAAAEDQDEVLARQQAQALRLDYLFRHNDADSDADWATGLLRSYLLAYRLGPPDQAGAAAALATPGAALGDAQGDAA